MSTPSVPPAPSALPASRLEEADAAAQLDYLRAILGSLPDPIMVIGRDGRYLDVLGGADRGNYDAAAPLVGLRMQDVLPEEKWRFFLDVVHRAIDKGCLQTVEYRLSADEVEPTDNDGPSGAQWFQGRVYPITGRDAVVWLVVNISAQKALEERLKHLSEVDDLTGALNRRCFLERLEALFGAHYRRSRGLAVIVFDVDHFKSINDIHGHAQGDRVLKRLGEVVAAGLRADDVFGRTGGEEFAIGCPATDAQEAEILAERLRSAVGSLVFQTPTGKLHVTVSLGVTQLGPDDKDVDASLHRADQALYLAKRRGRNQTCVWAGGEEPDIDLIVD
ncbi:diguanylate cyclase [Azoarcus sp. TTM-91]|uniref:diguanylate cyclase n=1 Tax=Azoarcus sp. TTM-91 TaxID=2691581 RepID=UPI00145F7EAC|nr:diguanylate cyclase [Azoarcus sp. TTM-91]